MSYEVNVSIYAWKWDSPNASRYVPGSNYIIDDFDSFIDANFELLAERQRSMPKFPGIRSTYRLDFGDMKDPLPKGLMERVFGLSPYSPQGEGRLAMLDMHVAAREESESISGRGSVYERSFYYFITKVNRLSAKTAELVIELDYLNTFKPGIVQATSSLYRNASLTFSEETRVMREHVDRFRYQLDRDGRWNGRVIKKIDRMPEDFSCVTFPERREEIPENPGYEKFGRCYLVYKTRNNLSTTDLENPLGTYLAYENGVPSIYGEEDTGVPESISLTPVGRCLLLWKWQNPNLGGKTIYHTGTTNPIFTIDEDLYSQCDGIVLTADPVTSSTVFTITFEYLLDNGTRFVSLGGRSALTGASPVVDVPSWNYVSKGIEGDAESEEFYQSVHALAFPGDYTQSSTGGGHIRMGSMGQVDRYDPRNVKIIALPYSPITFTGSATAGFVPQAGWEFESDTGLLTPLVPYPTLTRSLNHWNFPYRDNLAVSDLPTPGTNMQRVLRNDNYESKLWSSQFHSVRIVYDDQSYDFYPEWLDAPNFGDYGSVLWLNDYIEYRQSANISSKFSISIRPLTVELDSEQLTGKGASYTTYTPPLDYPFTMVFTRNNELPIFTSDYLNYIRTGYNYDIKKNERQNAMQWVSTATGFASSLIGAGRSEQYVRNVKGAGKESFYPGGVFGAVGGAVSFVGSAINNVIRSNQRDEDIARRLNENAMKAVTASGSADLDLFEGYSNNKLWYIEGWPLPQTKKALADLFHYYGYARDEKKVPDIHTRLNFNFLQGEVVFNEEGALDFDVLGAIKEAFLNGVTYLWKYTNEDGENEWDFEGKRANLETFFTL